MLVPSRPPNVGSCDNYSVDAAGTQFVMAAHRTTRSRAIGSSFVGPKNAAISKSDRVAPAIVSPLHQLAGTQIPTTVRAARKNSTAAITARKNPESGKPEDTVTWPNGPLSPSLQGQAHLNSPLNSAWVSLSRGTRYEAAKCACNTRSAAKSHFNIVSSSPVGRTMNRHREPVDPQVAKT